MMLDDFQLVLRTYVFGEVISQYMFVSLTGFAFCRE